MSLRRTDAPPAEAAGRGRRRRGSRARHSITVRFPLSTRPPAVSIGWRSARRTPVTAVAVPRRLPGVQAGPAQREPAEARRRQEDHDQAAGPGGRPAVRWPLHWGETLVIAFPCRRAGRRRTARTQQDASPVRSSPRDGPDRRAVTVTGWDLADGSARSGRNGGTIAAGTTRTGLRADHRSLAMARASPPAGESAPLLEPATADPADSQPAGLFVSSSPSERPSRDTSFR